MIRRMKFNINNIPLILWGEYTDNLYLYVHGMDGCKEDAEAFASIAEAYGYQTLSIDLPGHGERAGSMDKWNPREAVSDLRQIANNAVRQNKSISLYAKGIGAYFSMLAFTNMRIEKCLFVSPAANLEKIIKDVMSCVKVSEKELYERKSICIDDKMLSWQNFDYARSHVPKIWNVPTKILYGLADEAIPFEDVENLSEKFGCNLTVCRNKEQKCNLNDRLSVLYNWINENVK